MPGSNTLVFILSTVAGLLAYVLMVRNRPDHAPLYDVLPNMGSKTTVFVLVVIILLISVHFTAPFVLPGEILYEAIIFLGNQFFVSFILGFALGVVLGDWLKYVLKPDLLKLEHISLAHRRWGYLIVTLIFIGLFTDDIRSLVRNLSSVSTPIGGFTLNNQSRTSTAEIISASEPNEQEITYSASLQAIKDLPDLIDRDKDYIKLLYKSKEDFERYPHFQFANLNIRHEANEEVIRLIFAPMSDCLLIFMNRFYDPLILHRETDRLNIAYLSDLRNRLNSHSPVSEALEELLGDMTEHITASGGYGQSEDQNVGCEHFSDSYREFYAAADGGGWLYLVDAELPYMAILLSNIFLAAGAPDTGVFIMSDWIDQYREKVPLWYIVRAELHLGMLLEKSERLRALVDVLERTVKDLEHILHRALNSSADLEVWAKICGEASAAEAKLAFTLATQINRLAYYAALINKTDQEIESYARMISELPLKCFYQVFDEKNSPNELSKVEMALEEIQGAFLLTYGIVLVHRARQRELILDQDRLEQTKMLQSARIALERSIRTLNISAIRERAKLDHPDLRLQERVFKAHSAQEDLALAQNYLRVIITHLQN